MSMAGRLYNYIGKVLLVIIGAVSTTWAFVDIFNISVCMPFVLLFIFLLSSIFMLIMQLKHKHIVILCLGICMFLFIIFFRKTLELGVVGIANRIIKVYNDYFTGNAINEYELYYDKSWFLNTPEQINTLFICIVEVEYIYILVAATYYKIFPSIHIIVSMAFIIAGPALGAMPCIACMALLIFYYLCCVIFGKNKTVYLGRMGVIAAAVALITGVVLLVSNPKKYDGEARYDNYSKIVDTLSDTIGINVITNKLESMFVSGDVSQGGISGGQLGKVDRIKYSGEKMFKIIMDRDSNNVYLKGFVGNYYNGRRWEPMSMGDIHRYSEYASDVYSGYEKVITDNFGYVSSSLGESVLKNIDITYINGSRDYTMYPYYSDIEVPQYLSAIIPARPEGSQVQYNYCSIDTEQALTLLNIDDYISYRESEFFVGISTDVPDNIVQLFDEILGGGSSSDNYLASDAVPYIEQRIKFIKEYLADNTSYTLNPGKLESDKDYVEEFLVNKKKGYCTAYASAATLMFRYYGIPARYVEGYVITQKEQDKAKEAEGSKKIVLELEDRTAHAWTEIYIPDVGFIPIEVTPGYYSNNNSGDGNNPDESTEQSSEQTTTEKENQTSKEQVTTGSDAATTDDSGKIVTNKEKDKKNDEKIFIIFGLLACVAVITVVFVIIGRTNSIRRHARMLDYDTKDIRKNIKVLSIYLRKCMDRYKIGYSKDRSIDEIADDINKIIDRIYELNNDISNNSENKNKITELPDSNDTITVLWIIEKQKYSDKNVEFTLEEYQKVRQYVENLKNSLQYFKNRL